MKPETPRSPPQDLEIEAALIGALLIDNAKIDVVAADLESWHFSEPLHQRIYEFTVHLVTEGPVTPIILNSVMKRDAAYEEVGGHAYLISLVQACPALPDVQQYARRLIELATKRELIAIGEGLADEVYESPEESPAQALADRATDSLLAIGRVGARPVLSPYEVALSSLKRVEDMLSGQPVPLVRTGFKKLDEEIGGLRGGDMVLVPAASGMGKSALCGSIALNVARGRLDGPEDARRPPVPVIVFSLEMTREQWVERMVCDIDFDTAIKPMWYSRVRNGHLNGEEFGRFGAAAGILHGLPLEIHDEDDVTIQQIGVRARAFKAKHGNAPLGLVVIDYAQIVSPTDPRAPREQQVAAIARGAKAMAKRLGWPVVMGSQVNEGAAMRSKDEKRPQLSDTRESKALGNEADIALSPYRQAYFVENRKPADAVPGDGAWIAWRGELKACRNRLELLALKNRHGRRFDLELYCDMGASAIRDAAPVAHLSQSEQDLLDLGY